MAITVNWDNAQKTALYIRSEGSWTWEEFHQAFQDGTACVRSVDHSVDIIIHMVDFAAQRPPTNAFKHWLSAMHQVPDNTGLVILVPGNGWVQAFASAFLRVLGDRYPFKVAFAQTLDEAQLVSARLHQRRGQVQASENGLASHRL